MAARIPDSLERLTQADLIGENEKLSGAFAELRLNIRPSRTSLRG
jgi:hypothetical protein